MSAPPSPGIPQLPSGSGISVTPGVVADRAQLLRHISRLAMENNLHVYEQRRMLSVGGAALPPTTTTQRVSGNEEHDEEISALKHAYAVEEARLNGLLALCSLHMEHQRSQLDEFKQQREEWSVERDQLLNVVHDLQQRVEIALAQAQRGASQQQQQQQQQYHHNEDDDTDVEGTTAAWREEALVLRRQVATLQQRLAHSKAAERPSDGDNDDDHGTAAARREDGMMEHVLRSLRMREALLDDESTRRSQLVFAAQHVWAMLLREESDERWKKSVAAAVNEALDGCWPDIETKVDEAFEEGRRTGRAEVPPPQQTTKHVVTVPVSAVGTSTFRPSYFGSRGATNPPREAEGCEPSPGAPVDAVRRFISGTTTTVAPPAPSHGGEEGDQALRQGDAIAPRQAASTPSSIEGGESGGSEDW